VSELDLSIRIDACAATVFRYFTDPDRMCEWMGVSVDADARPDGTYRVDVTGRDVASGSYVEIVPHSRIVWTWGWEGDPEFPPGTSTVEVTLVPDGDGTVVRLRHTGLPAGRSASRHREGWEHYLARLGIAGAGGDPGPDEWVQPS
jgi:uncharacterized protein YndB with AHSA1/START domain